MGKADVPEEALEARARLAERLHGLLGEGDIPRLAEALTHPSFANEWSAQDNQRLELLGDAVLGLIVTEALLSAHPTAGEGELTRMRSALVNGNALAAWARSIGLGECLAMGKGARAATEKDQTNVLADAVEALIAAVYLAKGLDGARALVGDVTRELGAETQKLASLDPKSELQERVQSEGQPAPRYRVIGSHGTPQPGILRG